MAEINKLAVESWSLILTFSKPQIYVNLKSDGSYKSCNVTTENFLRKTKVYKVTDNMYTLILRIYETYKERDVFRGTKKIAEVYRVKGRKY